MLLYVHRSEIGFIMDEDIVGRKPGPVRTPGEIKTEEGGD